VAILLTDGQGSGGIGAAQTAAGQNTTIYTIGFGSANRNKLEEIAGITGGEFHYVNNAADLPDVFSRVAENATTESDADGDGIPTVLEPQLRTGAAGTLELDPFDPDSDNDGVTDGTEVGAKYNVTQEFTIENGDLRINESSVGSEFQIRDGTGFYRQRFYKLHSNPDEVDSDGDGLTDGTEHNERQKYRFIDDPDLARSAVENNDSSAVAERFSSTDPYDWDTDGDGWSDGREAASFTNPRSADTDGDGIRDSVELTVGEDPTLHDFSPPNVHVSSVKAEFYVDLAWDLREALHALGKFALSTLEAMVDLGDDAMKALSEWGEDALEEFKSWTADEIGKLSNITDKTLAELKNWSAGAVEGLKTWSGDRMEKLNEFGKKQLNAFKDWDTGAIEGIKEWKPREVQALKDLNPADIRGFKGYSFDEIKEIGELGEKKIRKLKGWGRDDIQKLADKEIAKLQDAAATKIEGGIESVNNFYDDLKKCGNDPVGCVDGYLPSRTAPAGVGSASGFQSVTAQSAQRHAARSVATDPAPQTHAAAGNDDPKIDPFGTKYTVVYTVSDPSGVEKAIVKKNRREDFEQFSGTQHSKPTEETVVITVHSKERSKTRCWVSKCAFAASTFTETM